MCHRGTQALRVVCRFANRNRMRRPDAERDFVGWSKDAGLRIGCHQLLPGLSLCLDDKKRIGQS